MTEPAPLACPKCHSLALRSDEAATIGYPVRLTRAADGSVEVHYGEGMYETFDEGTEYSGDLWCRDCGAQIKEDDLLEPDDLPDEED